MNEQSPPILVADGLGKRYATAAGSLDVFHDLQVEVRAGEFAVIVGPSGVGKSTLLHILGCLDRATSGHLHLDGREVGHLAGRELTRVRNRAFGFVFQFHHLLPEFTALENVMMPGLIAGDGREPAHARAQVLLEQMGVGERGHHYPSQLSGGEQQRVAIARALTNQPRVLFLDEPTGNLDEETGQRVFEVLLERQQELGVATVMVTHNMQLAGRGQRILQMSNEGLKPL